MTWTKLSDDFSDDCWTLSDAAFRLHTEALIWSNRKLLDCVIPKADLARVSPRSAAAEELVAVGWWIEHSKVFVIRHHAGYQRTREQVVHQQKMNSRNGRKGGRPRERFNPDETESQSESLSETETERDGTGQDRPRRGSSNNSSPAVSSFDPDEKGELDVNDYDRAFFSR